MLFIVIVLVYYLITGTSDRASRSSSGGNPVCPRETPKWQKPITRFFASKDSDHGSTDEEDIGNNEFFKFYRLTEAIELFQILFNNERSKVIFYGN